LDNVTHTLLGVALARAGAGRRTPGAAWTLALGCNAPDVDIVSGLFGTVAYLDHHRGFTHAFAFAPLLAAPLAAVMARWRGGTFRAHFLLALLGIASHIVSDLWTMYGTRALLPFDSSWYALDWIFIVDPVLIAAFAAAAFLPRLVGTARPSQIALAVAALYVCGRGVQNGLATVEARELAGPDFSNVRALPTPLSLSRWRVVAGGPDELATGAIGLRDRTRTFVRFEKIRETDLVARVARESRAARVFLDFSPFPRLDVRSEGDVTRITWRDLRFSDREDRFVCEVRVDGAGRIVSETVRF
jgi:inner membrane protein